MTVVKSRIVPQSIMTCRLRKLDRRPSDLSRLIRRGPFPSTGAASRADAAGDRARHAVPLPGKHD